MKKQKYYYKLTDQNLRTYNGFQWELGVEKTAPGKGELCTEGWLHLYHSPLLAVLLNPIHADIHNPRLFKAGCSGKSLDDRGLKIGWERVRLVEEIPLPEITLTQKIAFGILCSLRVHKDKDFQKWAHDWLSGKDRSKEAAARAAEAAGAAEAEAARAVEAAEWAAARAAEWAAAAAAEAAARAAEWTAEAAARAAEWAVEAAEWAAEVAETRIELDFIKIAEEAMKY